MRSGPLPVRLPGLSAPPPTRRSTADGDRDRDREIAHDNFPPWPRVLLDDLAGCAVAHAVETRTNIAVNERGDHPQVLDLGHRVFDVEAEQTRNDDDPRPG
jgi:hypothetical protein